MGLSDYAKTLAHYHGEKLDAEQLADYTWFFGGQGKLADKVLDRWKFLNSPSARFPSINQLLQIATDLRNEVAREAKAKEPVFGDMKRSAKTPHSQRSIAMMFDFYDGKLTRPQYLAAMRKMDVDFPGMGWAGATSDLENFWADHGHEQLDKDCDRAVALDRK